MKLSKPLLRKNTMQKSIQNRTKKQNRRQNRAKNAYERGFPRVDPTIAHAKEIHRTKHSHALLAKP
jgi:hypothetical protein